MAASADSSTREPLDFRRLFAGLLLLVLALLFFSMISYPAYAWLRARVHHDGLAGLVTTLGGLIVVAVPLTFLVGAVSREALRLSETPFVEETTGATIVDTLPSWLPFADEIKPHRAEIVARTQAIADQIETFVVDALSRATQGTLA